MITSTTSTTLRRTLPRGTCRFGREVRGRYVDEPMQDLNPLSTCFESSITALEILLSEEKGRNPRGWREIGKRLVEYSVGARGNTKASDLFYDLLSGHGLMILGVRRFCCGTGRSYV